MMADYPTPRAEVEKLPMQWRIATHDGHQVGSVSNTLSGITQEFDRLCRDLQGLSIPRELFPRLEGREIHQDATFGPWMIYGDVVRKHLGPRHAEPDAGPFTHIQVQRIMSRQYGWGDPCVICGGEFRNCPHTTLDTEAFINKFKAWTKVG